MATFTRPGRHRLVNFTIEVVENFATTPNVLHQITLKDDLGVVKWQFTCLDHLLETSLEFTELAAKRYIDLSIDGANYNKKRVLAVGNKNPKKVYKWIFTGDTLGMWNGTGNSSSGTYAVIAPTTGNAYNRMMKGVYSNVVTTLNQTLGVSNSVASFSIGNGFDYAGFFGFVTFTNGGRLAAVLTASSTPCAGDPGLVNNTIGFIIDAADNGLISFLCRRDAGNLTKVSTGLTATSTSLYQFRYWCAQNGTEVFYYLKDLVSGTEVISSVTTGLPLTTTFMFACVHASNAALTPVNSIRLILNDLELSTDY